MKRIILLLLVLAALAACASPNISVSPAGGPDVEPSQPTEQPVSLSPQPSEDEISPSTPPDTEPSPASPSPSEWPSPSELPSQGETAAPPSESEASPSPAAAETPIPDPMVEKKFKGLSLQVRSSWKESSVGDGAVAFTIDGSCLIMLQQIEATGDLTTEDMLDTVAQSLVPGSSGGDFTKDGFSAKSRQYTKSGTGKDIQCVSNIYAHGKVLSVITILLEGGSAEGAQSTLRPILDTLKLTKV